MKTRMKKPKGRPSRFTEDLTKQIVNLLGGGISIRATCAALGIAERTFFDHCSRDAAFLAEIQRARAMGKIRLIREIITDRDWRAKSWYLSVTYPREFGRVAERQLPEEPPPKKEIPFAVIINTGGKTLAQMVDFPRAPEAKASESSGVELFDPNLDGNIEQKPRF
jgi:hypothetical protein